MRASLLLLAGMAFLVGGGMSPRPGGDPLACFRDSDGRVARAGDTVRDIRGRPIGWVSASQCLSRGGGLRVRLDGPGGGLLTVEAQEIAGVDSGEVTLAAGLEQLPLQTGRGGPRANPIASGR
jgi:hypothetical protein